MPRVIPGDEPADVFARIPADIRSEVAASLTRDVRHVQEARCLNGHSIPPQPRCPRCSALVESTAGEPDIPPRALREIDPEATLNF